MNDLSINILLVYFFTSITNIYMAGKTGLIYGTLAGNGYPTSYQLGVS